MLLVGGSVRRPRLGFRAPPRRGAKASITIRIALRKRIATKILFRLWGHPSPVKPDIVPESWEKLPHREIFHKRFFKVILSGCPACHSSLA